MEWISRRTTSKTTTSCHGWTRKTNWPAAKRSWRPRRKRSSSPRKSLSRRRRRPKLPPNPRLNRPRRRLPRRRPSLRLKRPRQRLKPSPKLKRKRRLRKPPRRKSAKSTRRFEFRESRKGLGNRPGLFFLKKRFTLVRETLGALPFNHLTLSNRESLEFTNSYINEISNFP